MPYNVFLSYSWFNSAERIALTGAIAAIENVHLSVDRDFVSFGAPIHPTVLRMIDAADCFVALLTIEGLNSREVLDEITHAHARKKLIIPILEKGITREALPILLQDLRWVSYDLKNFEAVIRDLTTSIRKLANSPAGSDSTAVPIEIGQPPAAREILESAHPTTLRVFLGLSWLYWILTGPWPLLWLFMTSGRNWGTWWVTVTNFPHLYLHSTCVGLFLAWCLRYPLGAVFASSVFRRAMWAILPVLLVLTFVFIVNELTIGPEIYGKDPANVWLPLSSALQMLVFMLSAAVAILIGFGTITHLAHRTADIKVSNRLFGTLLYGILWLPMRSAYETQGGPDARELLRNNSQLRLWMVIFIFILAGALLALGVFYKQRRYLVPVIALVASSVILLVALLYPDVCMTLFGRGGESLIYVYIFAIGLVCYLGMTLYESKTA